MRRFIPVFLVVSIVHNCGCDSGESTSSQARGWFKTVVEVEPNHFTNIQHYTIQWIDFSHHFRFEFGREDDLELIIKRHGLAPAPKQRPMKTNWVPDWYDPFRLPDDAPRFGRDGNEPVLLIVDPDARIAYFEFVHI